MSKKKKRKKKKLRAQILQNLNYINEKTSETSDLKTDDIKKRTNETNKKAITEKNENLFLKSDLKKFVTVVGVIVILFSIVILLNSQTQIVANFTDKLVEWFHINR